MFLMLHFTTRNRIGENLAFFQITIIDGRANSVIATATNKLKE